MQIHRYIAGVLLIILILPVLGVFTWLHLEKYQVRRAVKHQLMEHIERDALVKLTFHQNEVANKLDWEHDREFKFSGEMYDVVEQEVHADSISYWCWEDRDESALNKQLTDLTDLWLGHAPERQEQHDRVQRFIRQLFHKYSAASFTLVEFESNLYSKPYLIAYCSIKLACATPPPKV